MKTIAVVALVLVAFAAFFLTFLIAPIAVLLLFYVVFASRRERPEQAGPDPATSHDSRHPEVVERGDANPGDVEPAPPLLPARRPRITVVSDDDRHADEPADAVGTTTPATPRPT